MAPPPPPPPPPASNATAMGGVEGAVDDETMGCVRDSSRWCLIESDPAVFSELIERFGVRGVELTEIYGLDEETFHCHFGDGRSSGTPGDVLGDVEKWRKVYGLIFLFKWSKEVEMADDRRPVFDKEVFFARQVIQNACATQALLMVLMNSGSSGFAAGDDNGKGGGCSAATGTAASGAQQRRSSSSAPSAASTGSFELGEELQRLRAFTADFDAQMKGLAISNSEVLRAAHNSFRSSSSSFQILDDEDDEKADDAFHFTSFVAVGNDVFELDGLKEGPLRVGQSGGLSAAQGERERQQLWLEETRKELQRRVAAVQAGDSGGGEIRFNLLAVVEKEGEVLRRQIEEHRHLRQRSKIKLLSFGEDIDLDEDEELDDSTAPPSVPSLEDMTDDVSALKLIVTSTTAELQLLREKEAAEQIRWKRWRSENARRRHDYVPFLLCALRQLARRGELLDAYRSAKEETEKRLATNGAKAKASEAAAAASSDGREEKSSSG